MCSSDLHDVRSGTLDQYRVVLLSESQQGLLDPAEYRFEPCGFSYRDWKLPDVRELMRNPDKPAVFERQKIRYVIARRRSEAGPP